ncbi:MAG: glutaredoxin family protein [candidate division Zixibacteria bacterium]|nr:glutaredoxin family protein [candidate division Zixibacteria bacterium]
MAVTIYIKEGCPFCKALKEDLDKKGVKYEEINVIKNPEYQEMVIKLAKKRAVPVMLKDGKVTVGFGGA